MTQYVHLLVEGILDETLLRHLVAKYTSVEVVRCHGKSGKTYIRDNIAKFNIMAKAMPLICLIDLDNDACPLALIDEYFPNGKTEKFLFRVAVRMVESWLIADRENFARYLGIPANKLSAYPDTIPNPKAEIVNACRNSKKNDIRLNIVPSETSGGKVGGAYVPLLEAFILNHWNPDTARQDSESLDRALNALSNYFS